MGALALVAFGLCAPRAARATDRITELKARFPPCTRTASKDDEEAAKHAHKAALEAFEREEFQMASRLWSDAYHFDCSRPRVFLNLGSAFEQAGDPHSALAVYELFQERAAEAVPPDLATKMHDLRLKVKELDGVEAAKASASPPAAQLPKAAPAPEMIKPLGIAPWVIVAGGGTLAVTGGVLLGVGLSQAGSAADECANPEARTGCSVDAAGRGESAELMSQVGQGLLYGGAAIAALGLVLEFAANTEQPKATEASFVLMPQVGGQFAGLAAAFVF